jgi:hypothetical protein
MENDDENNDETEKAIRNPNDIVVVVWMVTLLPQSVSG